MDSQKKPDGDEIDWDAAIRKSEMAATVEAVSEVVFSYYDSLCNQGFTREQAYQMARDWQTIYWSQVIALTIRGGKSQ